MFHSQDVLNGFVGMHLLETMLIFKDCICLTLYFLTNIHRYKMHTHTHMQIHISIHMHLYLLDNVENVRSQSYTIFTNCICLKLYFIYTYIHTHSCIKSHEYAQKAYTWICMHTHIIIWFVNTHVPTHSQMHQLYKHIAWAMRTS